MSFWDQIKENLEKEMPNPKKSGGSFLGALIFSGIALIIWFPFKLAHELQKLFHTKQEGHATDAERLYNEAVAVALKQASPDDFGRAVTEGVPETLRNTFQAAYARLYARNAMLTVPRPPQDHVSLKAIKWRDRLRSFIANGQGDMEQAARESVNAAIAYLPALPTGDLTTPLRSFVPMGQFIESIIEPLKIDTFPVFRDKIEERTFKLSGIPLTRQSRREQRHRLVSPTDYKGDPADFVIGTPIEKIPEARIRLDFPQDVRFSHTYLCAGTGAGKTTALRYFIGRDIERADCSVVVIDHQRALISEIMQCAVFDHDPDRLLIIDAADIENPPQISLFDMGRSRLNEHSAADRERLMTNAIELYEFIIGALLNGKMTSKQQTLFNFITRAMFAIPDANILTFHELLQKGGRQRFQHHIDTLDALSREFFATQYDLPGTGGFMQTREEVNARLWSVLSSQTFARMFSAAKSNIDLFAAMQQPGKVILINAEKAMLGEKGTELFGRFWLAHIAQIAAERSLIEKETRTPCFVYVDEAHNYVADDEKVKRILAEARQQNIGILLSHQHLGQLQTSVVSELMADTVTKIAARLNAHDAAAFAKEMRCDPMLFRQPAGTFVAFSEKFAHGVPLTFPEDGLSRLGVSSEPRTRRAHVTPPPLDDPQSPPERSRRRKLDD